MLYIAGSACAKIGHGSTSGFLLGRSDKQGDRPISLFMMQVILTSVTGNRVLGLRLPVEQVLTDGVVQIAGGRGIVLLGFLQGNEQ